MSSLKLKRRISQIEEKLEKLLKDATPPDLIFRKFRRDREEYLAAEREAEVNPESSAEVEAAKIRFFEILGRRVWGPT